VQTGISPIQKLKGNPVHGQRARNCLVKPVPPELFFLPVRSTE